MFLLRFFILKFNIEILKLFMKWTKKKNIDENPKQPMDFTILTTKIRQTKEFLPAFVNSKKKSIIFIKKSRIGPYG
jgi:hypothetical protein